MKMRIWELHAVGLDGAIRTTPDGEADIAGLVLSEKAYLVAVRDFRPRQLVEMVRQYGPATAGERLIAHYGSDISIATAGGRRLVALRGGMAPGPSIRRSDEVPEPVGGGRGPAR